MPSAPLLQTENLTQFARVDNSSHPVKVFAEVSFTLAVCEQVAILGARGAGKTALARAISLIDRPAGGRVLFESQDVTRAWGGRLRALRRGLQYVGGDARRSLSPRLSIEQVLTEPLQVHRLGAPAERRAQVEAVAAILGPTPPFLTFPLNALSSR